MNKKRISFNVSSEQYEKLRAAARSKGLGIAAFTRMASIEAAQAIYRASQEKSS